MADEFVSLPDGEVQIIELDSGRMAPLRFGEPKRAQCRLVTNSVDSPDEKRLIERATDDKSPRLLFAQHCLPLLLLAALCLNPSSHINQAEASPSKANFARSGDSGASKWARKLTNDLADEPPVAPRKRSAHQQSGCDLLFSSAASEQTDGTKSDSAPAHSLARYCLCREPLQAPEESDKEAPSDSRAAINQLDCRPDTLNQLTLALAAFAGGQQKKQTAPRIDYLIVQANLTDEVELTSAKLGSQIRALRVDQLALTLNLEEPFNGLHLDSQLNALIHQIDANRLQSLSISLKFSGNQQELVNFDGLLSNLGALSRLEIECSAKPESEHIFARSGALVLSLNSRSLKHQGQLRWLNLASNQNLEFNDQARLFEHLVKLEYLNLESSNLARFHLFSLFQEPSNFRFLSSLNLSKNRLQSLRADFFCCSEASSDNPAISHPSFASLNQLDLSYNQLTGITLKEAESILRTMPRLVHLYLQHNRIVHLQMDSLLLPAQAQIWPHSIVSHHHGMKSSQIGGLTIASSLDFIDISHNRLTSLSTFNPNGFMRSNSSALPRLKSINLSHNQLTQPIDFIDAKFVDRFLFTETFEFSSIEVLRDAQLAHLKLHFDMDNNPLGRRPSFCDHLSLGGQSSDDSPSEISLDHNRIKVIDAHQFNGERCAVVELLRLDHNEIDQISPDAFRWLSNLRQLHLNDNRLDRLNNSRIFSSNIRLNQLSLARNNIHSLDGRVFENLKELERLDMSGNHLVELQADLFVNNGRLMSIDLSKNRLIKLSASIFGLKELRHLLLDGNRLERVALGAKSLSTGLSESTEGGSVRRLQEDVTSKRQKFSQSKIKQKRINTYEKRHLLRDKSSLRQSRQVAPSDIHDEISSQDIEIAYGSLILSANQLGAFNSSWLSNGECSSANSSFIRYVKLLALDRNLLEEITNDTFAVCMFGLEILDLSSNRLTRIQKSAFERLEELQHLNLAHNYLLTVQDVILSTSQLVQLDLSDNLIGGLNNLTGMFRRGNASNLTQVAGPSLESLDLSDNQRLDLDTVGLIEFMSLFGPTLRHLDLRNISSVETKLDSFPNIRVPERLELAELSIGCRRNLDSKFLQFLRGENVAISKFFLRKQHFDQALWTLTTRKLIQNEVIELEIVDSQVTNRQLARMFEQISADNETVDVLQITRLDLSSNMLDHWPIESASALKLRRLRTLDLSSNKLTSLPEGLNLKSLLPDLESLNLSHNQLTWISFSSFIDSSGMINDLNVSSNVLATLNNLATVLLATNRAGRITIDLSRNENTEIETIRPARRDLGLKKLMLGVFEHLILDKDDLGGRRCDSIQQFIRRHQYAAANETRTFVRPGHSSERQGLFGKRLPSGNEQDLEYLNNMDKSCARLLDWVDTLILSRSTLPLASLKNLASQLNGSNRLIHLDISQSRISSKHFEPGNILKLGSVVYLDLSRDELTGLASNFCANHDLVNLKTLNLSGNQIESLSINSLSFCNNLNNLDLSENKVKSLVLNKAKDPSNLLVLRLNKNKLAQLEARFADSFPHLRHLDLRDNRFAVPDVLIRVHEQLAARYVHLYDSQPDNLISDLDDRWLKDRLESTSSGGKLRMTVDDNAIRIASSRSGERYSLQLTSMDRRTLILSAEPNASHIIRFCTLNRNQTHRACLDTHPDGTNEHCFLLHAPPKGPTCLTNLDELPSTSFTKREGANLVDPQGMSSTDRLDKKQGHVEETSNDAILNLIESLKESWLRLKQFDLSSYLVSLSRIQEDSILLKLDGKYPIYMLTVIKCGLVVAAISVIILATAMFALLSSTISSNGGQLKRMSSAKSNSSEEESKRHRDESSPQLATIATTLSTNDNSVSFSTDDNTRGKTSSSSMRSNESGRRAKMPTLNDRSQTQLLSANQLLNEHQQLQACSTPSSSIARSGSFETAETMQAVDSLQGSNVHSLNTNQTGENDELAGQQTPTNDGQWQHAQQPVATVMRMVKSNSAQTFDRRPRPPVRAQAYCNRYAYGTLSATRADQNPNETIYERQAREQIYIPQSMSFISSTLPHRHYEPQEMRSNEHEDELDPTTLSLLSINTQLSSHGYAAGMAAKLSPQVVSGAPQQQQQVDHLLAAPSLSLCQHHTAKLLEQQHKQHQHHNQVIFEQDELEVGANQQQQQQQQQQQLAFYGAGALAPPPPLSPSLYHYQGQ